MKALQMYEDVVPGWKGSDWVFKVDPDAEVVPDEDFTEYQNRYSRPVSQRWCFDDYYFCEHCHKVHLRSDMVAVHTGYGSDDHYYLCEECFDIALDNGHVDRCEDCGEVYDCNSDLLYYMDNLERLVCGACQENYTQCTYCHGWYVTDDMTHIQSTGEYACESCHDDGRWNYCDRCDTAYDEDELHYTDDDECLCDACYEESYDYRRGVVDYGACHSDDNQLSPIVCDGEPTYETRCCGFELEYSHPDGTVSADNLFVDFDRADLIGVVKVTRDGTVDGEVVTAPVSLAWLYQEPCKLKEVLNIMVKNGCTAWRQNLVGGHIHISDYGLSRWDKKFIARVVNACRDFFRVISGRTQDMNAFDCCKFGEHADYNGDYRAEHGCAVNIHTQYPTIEFRFWGGTLNFKSLRARATMCLLFVEYCRSTMDEATWKESFADPDTLSVDSCGFEASKYIAKYYSILLGFFENISRGEKGRGVLEYCANRVKRDREKWFCCQESECVFEYLKQFETEEE